jgi:alpha-glucosidase
MTGRHLTDDLNAEVRGIIRRTMIEINPGTILLGEVDQLTPRATFRATRVARCNDHANFTRPVWGWL